MVRGAGCGFQVPMGWVQGTVAVQPPGAICGGTSQWDNRGDIKSRVPRQVLGEGVFLGEQANLEFLDLIRKQLGYVQGGVAWGRTEPLGHGPALQKKAWRGAGESDLAKTQNSMRLPLRGPEPKCQLPLCSEATHVSGDPHTSSYFRRQSRPHLYSKNPANGSSSEGLCACSNQGPISSALWAASSSPHHEQTSLENWSVTITSWASQPESEPELPSSLLPVTSCHLWDQR